MDVAFQNRTQIHFWQYLVARRERWKQEACVIFAWRDIMLAVVQGNLDYTTCNVPDQIFSEKFGGFENYTCSGITKMNPNTPKTFFRYHYVDLLFDFIP